MGTEVKDFGLSAGGGVNATTGYFPEGQLPSTVNNGMREVMSAVRRVVGDISGEKTASFSAQVYTLTSLQELTSLARGHAFTFIADSANTGTAQLAVGGLSAVDIKIGGNHLPPNTILARQAVTTVYDGAVMQLIASASPFAGTIFAVEAAGNTSANDTTYTRIALATETLDVGGNFASNYYTVPSTGFYRFDASATVAITSATASTLELFVEVADSGGTNVSYNAVDVDIVGVVSNPQLSGSIVLSLTAGQRVYMVVRQNNGGARNVGVPSRLSGCRIY